MPVLKPKQEPIALLDSKELLMEGLSGHLCGCTVHIITLHKDPSSSIWSYLKGGHLTSSEAALKVSFLLSISSSLSLIYIKKAKRKKVTSTRSQQ